LPELAPRAAAPSAPFASPPAWQSAPPRIGSLGADAHRRGIQLPPYQVRMPRVLRQVPRLRGGNVNVQLVLYLRRFPRARSIQLGDVHQRVSRPNRSVDRRSDPAPQDDRAAVREVCRERFCWTGVGVRVSLGALNSGGLWRARWGRAVLLAGALAGALPAAGKSAIFVVPRPQL
jgi:hypothetical protein